MCHFYQCPRAWTIWSGHYFIMNVLSYLSVLYKSEVVWIQKVQNHYEVFLQLCPPPKNICLAFLGQMHVVSLLLEFLPMLMASSIVSAYKWSAVVISSYLLVPCIDYVHKNIYPAIARRPSRGRIRRGRRPPLPPTPWPPSAAASKIERAEIDGVGVLIFPLDVPPVLCPSASFILLEIFEEYRVTHQNCMTWLRFWMFQPLAWGEISYRSGTPATRAVRTKSTGGFNWPDGSTCRNVYKSLVLTSETRRAQIPPTLATVLQLPMAVFRIIVGKSSAV